MFCAPSSPFSGQDDDKEFSDMDVFVEVNGSLLGPLSIEAMFNLAKEGDISGDARVKVVGEDSWQTANDLEGVFNWHITCAQCGERLRANLEILGEVGRCPQCGSEMTVLSPFEDAKDFRSAGKPLPIPIAKPAGMPPRSASRPSS